MNILHLAPHLNAGGITSYLRTLTKGSVQRKHKVYILTPGGDLEEVFRDQGVQVHIMDFKTKSVLSPKVFRSIGSVCQFIKEKDIQIIHAHTRVTQFIAHKVQSRMKTVFVSTCHGYFRPHLMRRLLPCWGDATIAISREVYRHLQEDFKVSEDKIALVETGIDLELFPEITPESKRLVREEFNISEDYVIGSIARLSDVKGMDILIQAVPFLLKKRQDFKVVLIGQGKQKEELKSLVQSLKLENIVLFNQSVDKTVKYLPLFDVFVVPSRSEGLGLSALEAQASGLAVVGSNVGGLKTVLTEKETGLLVPPEDPEKLAEAILWLLEHEDERMRIGKSARQFVAARFEATGMVEKILNLYARLMV